jgi:hypothetical protein
VKTKQTGGNFEGLSEYRKRLSRFGSGLHDGTRLRFSAIEIQQLVALVRPATNPGGVGSNPAARPGAPTQRRRSANTGHSAGTFRVICALSSPSQRHYPSWAFNSSAADLRISRDSLSSFTARAIDTAPTSVDNAAIAFILLDLRKAKEPDDLIKAMKENFPSSDLLLAIERGAKANVKH